MHKVIFPLLSCFSKCAPKVTVLRKKSRRGKMLPELQKFIESSRLGSLIASTFSGIAAQVKISWQCRRRILL